MSEAEEYYKKGLTFFPYILRYMDKHYNHNYRSLSTEQQFCLQSLILLKSLAKTYDSLPKKLAQQHHPSVQKYTNGRVKKEFQKLYKEWHIQEAVKYIRSQKDFRKHCFFKNFTKRFPNLQLCLTRKPERYYFTRSDSPLNNINLISEDGNTVFHIDLSLNLPLNTRLINYINPAELIEAILNQPPQSHNKTVQRMNKKHKISFEPEPGTMEEYSDPRQFFSYLTQLYRNATKVLFLQLVESTNKLKLEEAVKKLQKSKEFIDFINQDPKVAATTSIEQKIRQYFKTHKLDFWEFADAIKIANNIPKILHYQKLRHEIAHPGECGDMTLHPKRILHDFSNCLYLDNSVRMPMSVEHFWEICDYLSSYYSQIREADVDKRNIESITDKKKSYRKNIEELKKQGIIQKYEEEGFKTRNNVVHINGAAKLPRLPEERLLHAVFESSLLEKIEKFKMQKSL